MNDSHPFIFPHTCRMRQRSTLPLVLAVVVVTALVLWGIFLPGLMTEDSADQYKQAEHTVPLHDFHPPIMSIVLSFFIGNVGLEGLTLLMCLAGCLGVFAFLRELLELLAPGRWSDERRALVALLGFFLLLVPPSPLMFWLMSFTKDTWCLIFFFDLSACAFYLYRRADAMNCREFGLFLALFLVLTELVLLVRHNAVVILPAVMTALWMILHRRNVSRLRAAVVALALIPLHAVSNEGLCRAFSVRRLGPANVVMALDLVGFVVLDEQCLEELPYTRQHLNGDLYRTEFIFGDAIPLLWYTDKSWEGKPTIVAREFVYSPLGPRPEQDRQLWEEYRRAVLHHPLLFLELKWLNFRPLLGEFDHRHTTPDEIDYIDYLNPRTRGVRDWLLATDAFLAAHFHPHALVAAHWPWMLLNMGWIGGVVIVFRQSRQPRWFFLLVWLLVPLAYYASYLLASLARVYRFMYPSTALVEALTLALVLAYFLRGPRVECEKTEIPSLPT